MDFDEPGTRIPAISVLRLAVGVCQDPSGNLIKTYNNVVNGIAKGQYFQFGFDTKKQQISGMIDIGGGSSGEIYLKGKVTQNLSLFKAGEGKSDILIDRDFGNRSKF